MFDVLITGAHLATMAGTATPYGTIRDGALGIGGGRIAWIGAERDLPRGASAQRLLHVPGAWATPGLVDCHTHLVYAGNRVERVRGAARGATYAEIARAGGGINATVRATRAASDDELVAPAGRGWRRSPPKASRPSRSSRATGSTPRTSAGSFERRGAWPRDVGVDVRTTLLAAHAVPPEYAGRADDYIDLVCRETIPAAAAPGLRTRSTRSARRSASAPRRRDACSPRRARTGCR